jgi:hypothetical protein
MCPHWALSPIQEWLFINWIDTFRGRGRDR